MLSIFKTIRSYILSIPIVPSMEIHSMLWTDLHKFCQQTYRNHTYLYRVRRLLCHLKEVEWIVESYLFVRSLQEQDNRHRDTFIIEQMEYQIIEDMYRLGFQKNFRFNF